MWKVLILTICYTLIQSKPLDDDMLLYWRRAGMKACKPFTTYVINCNKCVCGADSIEYCTRMACPKKYISDESEYKDRD